MADRGGARGSAQEPTRFVGGAESPKREDEYSSVLETAQKHAYLLAYGGPGKGSEFPLTGDETLIGRDPAADVAIDDPSLSRRHALVVRRAGKLFLRDLGSANGTWLDGVLHNAERPLADGTRFRVGKTDFVLRDPTARAPQGDERR